MSRTPDHYDCPSGTIRTWRSGTYYGRQEVVYIRETEIVENPLRAYRHSETKRKWVRVGILCVDCGKFQRDKALPSVDRLTTARPPADGLPSSPIAADGIPTGSGG